MLIGALPKARNTSTDVEKTSPPTKRPHSSQKHLHGRGEDPTKRSVGLSCLETPPRTWRRQVQEVAGMSSARNTSTDVEKTTLLTRDPATDRKHLHGRGEDSVLEVCCTGFTETPPRTWRRPSFPSQFLTTSEKHLHGRGEDLGRAFLHRSYLETPPRTWRRRGRAFDETLIQRNTSTDVEKTPRTSFRGFPVQKHLHGRGEDFTFRFCCQLRTETPPRTWRRLNDLRRCVGRQRNTSTDVEKTRYVISYLYGA